VLRVLAPFFLLAFPLSEGADEGAEIAFFLPASKTIVITRLLASRFVAEMARVLNRAVLVDSNVDCCDCLMFYVGLHVCD
jgi:hypothetical protein